VYRPKFEPAPPECNSEAARCHDRVIRLLSLSSYPQQELMAFMAKFYIYKLAVHGSLHVIVQLCDFAFNGVARRKDRKTWGLGWVTLEPS
jgi:hypothetical protein